VVDVEAISLTIDHDLRLTVDVGDTSCLMGNIYQESLESRLFRSGLKPAVDVR
jgi:hypothetical protein